MTFTHAAPGTSAEAWAEAPDWGQVGELDLRGVDRLVVVAAHPDDESLGAGGLVALARERGLPVRLIVASDGEASHPDSPTHSPARLSVLRRAEVRAAAAELGDGIEVELLGLRDGGLAAHAPSLRARLDAVLAEVGGAGTLVVAPWRGDGHPDHECAGRVASDAVGSAGARLLEYPIWLWHWSEPGSAAVPWSRLARLELTPRQRAAKLAAIGAYASQSGPLSPAPEDAPMLSPGFLAHFARSSELFVVSRRGSVDAAHFDAHYRDAPDPWGYTTRWYEARKRAITLAALPRAHFGRALEVGCSIGVLTAELAPRCDAVLGVDVAAEPLRQARARLEEFAHVEIRQLAIPSAWPEGSFELIVLSEVGYYWDLPDLRAVIARCVAALAPGGVLLACHWRHPDADSPLSGDEVHAELARTPELVRTVQHVEEDFVLEVFSRPPAVSVARETGIV